MSTLNVASINSGPIGGFRNAVINGNPTINQRGYVSGTATSGANQYTLDRWRVVTSGQSITWADSANVRTVTAPAGGVEQVVEGINLGTGTYTLSWTGTATATVGGTAIANGTTVSLTGGVDTTVRFINGTFSLAQLEPGTRATPFERRPIGTELALCQRYHQIIQSLRLSGYQIAGNEISAPVGYMTTMRAVPTAVVSSFSLNNVATATVFAINMTTSGGAIGIVAGGTGILSAVDGTFTLSAEL